MKYAALVAGVLAASTTFASAQTLPESLNNLEPRMQMVLCGPYEKIVEILASTDQKLLFMARGAIVDIPIDDPSKRLNEVDMQGIAGVYGVWTNQDTGIATMVFTDRGGHTCLQATMSEFSPYMGE